MSETNRTECLGAVSVTEWVEDRRRTDRVGVSMPVGVCSWQNGPEKFEEVSLTLNASRDGLYFSSKLQCYRVGLSLLIAFPYSKSAERNVYFLGKVVRIDSLPDGRVGVAVELMTTIANKERLRPVSEQSRPQ